MALVLHDYHPHHGHNSDHGHGHGHDHSHGHDHGHTQCDEHSKITGSPSSTLPTYQTSVKLDLLSDQSNVTLPTNSKVDINSPSSNSDQPKLQKKKGNINVRAAFIHVLGDLIQSIGVLIAALIIFFKV